MTIPAYTRTGADGGIWSNLAGWSNSPPAGGPSGVCAVILTHSVIIDSAAGASQNGAVTIGPNLLNAYAGLHTYGTGGAGATSLGAGVYKMYITIVDTNGAESPISAEFTFTIAGVENSQLTLSAIPTGGATLNIYLTAAAGASNTETLYCSGVTTTTIDLTGGSWMNTAVAGVASGGATAQGSATPFPARNTTNAITITDGKTLTGNASCSLTLRGNVGYSNIGTSSSFTFAGPFTLTLDSSQSASPATTSYALPPGSTCPLVLNGTVSNHCTVTSATASSAAAGNIAGTGGSNNGDVQASYTDFSILGTASVNAINANAGSTTGTSLTSCTFNNCGQVLITPAINSSVVVTDCKFTNGLGPKLLSVGISAAIGTGVRNFLRNSFDATQLTQWATSQGCTITDNYFPLFPAFTGAAATIAALLQYNVLADCNLGTPSGPATLYGDLLNSHFIIDTRGVNPHWFSFSQQARNALVDGCIFEWTGLSQDGDCLLSSANGSGQIITAERNIVLPNGNNCGPGKLVSPLNSGFTFTVEHNTVTSNNFSTTGEQGVGVYSETYAGAAAMYNTLRANMVYTPAGSNPGGWFQRANQSTVSDAIANSAGTILAGNNGGNSIIAAAAGNVHTVFGAHGGYCDDFASPTAPMFTSTTGLGAGDVIAAQGFVDVTRNFATFDSAYLGNKPTAWASGHTYSVGDLVQYHSAAFYNNAPINYRCVTGHTSVARGAATDATNGPPGDLCASQVVQITGAPTSGNFTLSYRNLAGNNGVATGNIAWNAIASVVASTVQTAIQTLDAAVTVTGSGGPLPATPVTLTYSQVINGLDLNTSALSGGSSPAAAALEWHTSWELATHYRFRTTLPGLTYSAVSKQCTARDLIFWIYAGWRPTNMIFASATYSGDAMTVDAAGNALNGTLGAMAWVAGGVPGSLALLGCGF